MATRPSGDYRDFYDALRSSLLRPHLADRLMNAASTEGAIHELGLTPEMATDLKNVLLLLPQATASDGSQHTTTKLETESEKAIGTGSEFLTTSVRQLRSAARLSIGMSATIFLVGVGFLVIAAIRTFTHPDTVGATAVIAGIGVAQLLALFYRNPLRDIARATSNSQQAQMVVMSYILGVALVGESAYNGRTTAGDLRSLADLTEDALTRLERYTEERQDRLGPEADTPSDVGAGQA